MEILEFNAKKKITESRKRMFWWKWLWNLFSLQLQIIISYGRWSLSVFILHILVILNIAGVTRASEFCFKKSYQWLKPIVLKLRCWWSSIFIKADTILHPVLRPDHKPVSAHCLKNKFENKFNEHRKIVKTILNAKPICLNMFRFSPKLPDADELITYHSTKA